MNKIWTVILDIVIKVVRGFVPIMTEELKEIIQNWVVDFREKSRQTTNPWDDFIADFLYELFVKE